MIKKLMMKSLHRYVREPVDRCCEHGAAIPLEVLREVCAAAEETDSHWRLSNDHQKFPNCRCLTIRYAFINSVIPSSNEKAGLQPVASILLLQTM